MCLDLADDRLRGAGIVAGGVGGIRPLGVNTNRDRRNIGDNFRAGDTIGGDVWHRILQGRVELLLSMRNVRTEPERECGEKSKPGKQERKAEVG